MGVPKRILITTVRDRSSDKSAATIIAPQHWSLKTEMEVDVGETAASTPVRKRQRLDHLTREEKIMRRKLKNRVAAQSARDRKKARMDELEEQVTVLQAERNALVAENKLLRKRLQQCEEEKQRLNQRLESQPSSPPAVIKPVKTEPLRPTSPVESVASSGAIEYASLIKGSGSAADSCSLDDAIRLLASDDECDDLFALLQECSENLLDLPISDDSTPAPVTVEAGRQPRKPLGRERTPPACVVGPSPEELDSIKELIHFDHVYYKQEDSCDVATSDVDIVMEDSSAALAAAAATAASSPQSGSSSPPFSPYPQSPGSSPPTPGSAFLELEDTVVVIEDDDCCTMRGLESGATSPSLSILSQERSPFRTAPSPSLSVETGYESAVSPLSDCSPPDGSLFEESPWEDSLTELFPSLA
ncbi:unnamed protein product [Ixodes hexagonus]